MKILFIGDDSRDDARHLDALSRVPALIGHEIKTTFRKFENATEAALLAKRNGIDAVITSQQPLLEAALRRLPDYIPPPNRKQITVDDFAGSWIDLPYDIPMIVVNALERTATVPYEKFLLNRFVSKLTQPEKWFDQTDFKWKQVTEVNEQECMNVIESADLLAIDIETPGDDERRIKLVGYAAYNFATGRSECFVVHFNSEWAWRFVQRANRSRAGKILQGGIYDNAYFARWNCLPTNWLWDTMVLMHCWYSELPKRLDFLAAFALRKQRYWKDDGASGSLEDEMRYNARDCWATVNSLLALIKEIPEWAMQNYLQEFPMVFPSLNTALEGWRADPKAFAAVKQQKEAEAEKVLERVRFLLSCPTFNPRSPVQMNNLYELLGCKRGPRDTNAAAFMMKARAASPLNDFILGLIDEYKKAAKLISNYLGDDVLWHERLFYSIDPAGTDTGRAAARASAFWCGYNIQNVPRGDSIKQYLIADEGWLLAEPDKAQSEARCVGYMSGETKLIDLVESPHDYHAWNAQAFFGVPYETIFDEATGKTLNKSLRDLSKRTNHGANYNMGEGVMLDTMGPKKVAEAKRVLKLPVYMTLKSVCGYLLAQYEATYPKVKGLFYDKIISEIQTTSRLVSPFGWTRYFFAKPSKSNKPALNAAVAHGPQNLSVSIINREWYAIWSSTVHGNLRGRVRVKAQIHDSIPFQYRADDPAAAQEVLGMMNTVVNVRGADGITRAMKIPSDLKCGKQRWSELA